VGRGSRVEIVKELRWPDSLGLLYSAFTYYTGFKVNSGEYKVMGLAPYGEPKYVQTIYDHLVDLKEDGSFTLNQEYFGYLTGLTMTNGAFSRLFGAPPGSPSRSSRSARWTWRAPSRRSARRSCSAWPTVHRETGLENLCLAGGVALNCVGNGRILREGPFEELWIQPAAGDAGGALGVAQLIWHHHLGKPRRPTAGRDEGGSYLGPEFSEEEIEAYLRAQGAVYERLDGAERFGRVADCWRTRRSSAGSTGRMEFGPRALGARSISAIRGARACRRR
jgi:carbamoyltransferase